MSCECCLLSGRGLCEKPIPRLEESYRVCVCVSLGVIRCSNYVLHLQCVGRRDQTKQKVNLLADKREPTVNYCTGVMRGTENQDPFLCIN